MTGPRSAYFERTIALDQRKSGEACYYFHCFFKFSSSLGQADMFSLAGYSDMKSKLVTSLRYDDNDPSLH